MQHAHIKLIFNFSIFKVQKVMRGQIMVMRGHMIQNSKEVVTSLSVQVSFDIYYVYVIKRYFRSSEVKEG